MKDILFTLYCIDRYFVVLCGCEKWSLVLKEGPILQSFVKSAQDNFSAQDDITLHRRGAFMLAVLARLTF
jgi:hypothetical protein